MNNPHSEKMETSSFAGGNVVDYNQIVDESRVLGLQKEVNLSYVPSSACTSSRVLCVLACSSVLVPRCGG